VTKTSPNERARSGAFLLASIALHALLLLGLGAWLQAPDDLELTAPELVEMGLTDGDPGAPGSPPPAAPAAPTKAPEPVRPIEKPEPRVKPEPEHAASDFAIDASVPDEKENIATKDVPDAGVAASPAGFETGDDGKIASPNSGDGLAPLGLGGGLGFGTGGFGDGTGGPPGAVVGLQVDLDRIRESSLILETSALLELIPEWLHLLDGSGLDALHDFRRVFVASPSLTRASLVVSGRLRGGNAQLTRAVKQLGSGRGKSAAFRDEGGMKVAPWHNRGPTQRVVGQLGADQLVIARPHDVARALAVSAALAVRHGRDPRMEKAKGALALLAMYEGEAAALSVEGVHQYVRGEAAKHAPPGLRLSLHDGDELHAELRAFGYYASAAKAAAALPYFDALRTSWIDHPRAQYLGVQAALREARFTQQGKLVTLEVRLTMHQVRYLLGYVSKALKPRD
jgi:hypothetical protein